MYDIRRKIEKATSSGVNIAQGNDSIIADTLSVYTDGNTDGYVASNSLPSYDITTNIIEETLTGGTAAGLDAFNPLNDRYSFINFNLGRNVKFIQGDPVTYLPEGDGLVGLDTGRTYFVDPVIPDDPSQDITKIRIFNSAAQIGSASTVQVGPTTSTTDIHRFVLEKHKSRTLDADKILRKIPLSQNLFVSSNQDIPTNDIGILINGVQVRSPISDNQIYYGPLESVDLLNGGSGYDVVNPPIVGIETSTGIGAAVEPIIQGTVKEVFVDPQEFDIDAIQSISLTGGNGSGCVLQPILGTRNRELFFDSRDVFFNGGVDIVNETITFKTAHNLDDGELVYYGSNGNDPIGIGTAYDLLNQVSGRLSDGSPYFVRSVNSSTVRLFNTRNDALFGIAGINTVGLSTDTSASGIHKFRTESKNTLVAVKVLEEGSGYTHRKLRVKPTGISTSLNVVTFKNHGFESGEIVEYSTETTAIQGLTTTSSYFIKKLTNDTFQLADAGIGGTSTLDFNRGKYVNFKSGGEGFQIFNFPQIKVNIDVSYGSTITGDIVATPVVTGELIGGYLYEEGTNYGSTTLDKEVVPKVEIQNGKFAEFKPIIVNGRINDVAVVNRGREYNSSPEIKVISTGVGAGAVVRPIVENGQVIDAIVTNPGIGYSSISTEVRSFSRGTGGKYVARVRSLTLNNTQRFGDSFLSTKEDALRFSILGLSLIHI